MDRADCPDGRYPLPRADVEVHAIVDAVIVESSGKSAHVIVDENRGISWHRHKRLHLFSDRREVASGNYVVGWNTVLDAHERRTCARTADTDIGGWIEDERLVIASLSRETARSDSAIKFSKVTSPHQFRRDRIGRGVGASAGVKSVVTGKEEQPVASVGYPSAQSERKFILVLLTFGSRNPGPRSGHDGR